MMLDEVWIKGPGPRGDVPAQQRVSRDSWQRLTTNSATHFSFLMRGWWGVSGRGLVPLAFAPPPPPPASSFSSAGAPLPQKRRARAATPAPRHTSGIAAAAAAATVPTASIADTAAPRYKRRRRGYQQRAMPAPDTEYTHVLRIPADGAPACVVKLQRMCDGALSVCGVACAGVC